MPSDTFSKPLHVEKQDPSVTLHACGEPCACSARSVKSGHTLFQWFNLTCLYRLSILIWTVLKKRWTLRPVMCRAISFGSSLQCGAIAEVIILHQNSGLLQLEWLQLKIPCICSDGIRPQGDKELDYNHQFVPTVGVYNRALRNEKLLFPASVGWGVGQWLQMTGV